VHEQGAEGADESFGARGQNHPRPERTSSESPSSSRNSDTEWLLADGVTPTRLAAAPTLRWPRTPSSATSRFRLKFVSSSRVMSDLGPPPVAVVLWGPVVRRWCLPG
jgi:hypothetical protein